MKTLVECLKALDASTQRVIVMKLFEGRRFKEIAETLDATEEACRTRFSRDSLRFVNNFARRECRREHGTRRLE